MASGPYLIVACAGCTSLAITPQPWIPNVEFHDLVKEALPRSAAASPIFFGILTCPYIASQELAVREKTTFGDAYRITAETLVTVTAAGVAIAHGYFVFCRFLRSSKPTDAVTEPLQPQDPGSNFQATSFAAQESTAGSATENDTQDPYIVRAEAEEVWEPERQVHEGPAMRANQDHAALNAEFELRKQAITNEHAEPTNTHRSCRHWLGNDGICPGCELIGEIRDLAAQAEAARDSNADIPPSEEQLGPSSSHTSQSLTEVETLLKQLRG